MAINRWRGDAATQSKVLQFLQPNNTQGILTTVTVGNKTLTFSGWNAAEIVSGINLADFPELADVSTTVSGTSVQLTGPDNADFDVDIAISPTVSLVFEQGRAPVNQQHTLSFDGATGGTFTLTCNNETTSAITLKTGDALNTGGIETAIEALTSFTSGDVEARVSGSNVVLEWMGNYAVAPVSVVMNPTGLNNGGGIVFRETQAAAPATHDVWWLGIDGDYQFAVSDGTTPVTIKSNEAESTIADKLTAAWGGKVDVYIAVDATVLSQRSGNRRFMYLDLVGFPGVTTTLTVASILPTGDTDPVLIHKVVDRTDTTPAEVILIDKRLGSLSLTYNGEEIDTTSAGTTVADLNAAEQFGEWTSWSGPLGTGSGGAATLGGGSLSSDDLFLLIYISDGQRLAGTFLTAQLAPNSRGGGVDFDSARLIQDDGDGTFVVLQHGGDTNGAQSAVHELYLRPNTAGNTLAGTYKLAFAEGVTASIAHNASAATVQSTIITATGITVAVSGAGSANDPFEIDYTGDAAARALPTVAEKLFTGDGTGTASVFITYAAGTSAKFTVTVSQTADGGTYQMRSGNEGPVDFDWDEDATTFLAALQTFPTLSVSGDVTVAYNAASREYVATYANNLANQVVDVVSIGINSVTGSATGESTREISRYPNGPGNWAEPLNWSLGVLPEYGDEIIVDTGDNSIEYGLRQFPEVEIDTATEELTAVGGHDLQNGQKVRWLFGDTGPTGVSESTDYYVIDSDRLDGKFRISATLGGAAVNITAAGTGPHHCGVLATTLAITSTFESGIGLPRQANGFLEYRPQSLQIGVISTGQIIVGEGDGGASGLIRIDAGNSRGQVTVYETAGSEVVDKPAFVLACLSDDLNLLIHGGEVGIAVYDDEVGKLGSFNVLGGSLALGSVTVTSNAIATAGSLKCQRMSCAGLVRMT